MKKLLIILTFGFFSCGNEPKTIPGTLPTINSPVNATTKINDVDGDPDFIVPLDTISSHGPHGITRNVLQDKNGNIWFASWEGIIRYDDHRFTNFTLKEGLVHFHIFSILEDKRGNLWFGMIGGGAYRYDGKYFTLFTKTDGLAGDNVVCMLEDKTGNIWFATNEGASCYNGNTFTNFTTQDGLSSNSVNTIAEDSKGKLWFGTRGGVSCYDPSGRNTGKAGGKSFTNFAIDKDKSFHNVHTIIEDRIGNIWIAGDEGLYCYDVRQAVLTNLAMNIGSYIFEDKSENFWLSGSKDNHPGMILTKYDGKSFTEILVRNDLQQPFNNQIFGITQDTKGNIWFGTAIGVYRYDGTATLQ